MKTKSPLPNIATNKRITATAHHGIPQLATRMIAYLFNHGTYLFRCCSLLLITRKSCIERAMGGFEIQPLAECSTLRGTMHTVHPAVLPLHT